MAKEQKNEDRKPTVGSRVSDQGGADPVGAAGTVGADSDLPGGDDPDDLVADGGVGREADTRDDALDQGLIRLLASAPGPDCHALHTRLAEMLPFFNGAIEACVDDDYLGLALMDLERALRGEG